MPGDRGQHGVDVLDEVERLAVEQHVLLLDAECVRVALPEAVVEHAAALGEARTLAGDRRRERLLHAISASASISTRQRGSRSSTSTHVAAGHTSREDLVVGAGDLREVVCVRGEDPRADDVLRPGSGLSQGTTMISRHRAA